MPQVFKIDQAATFTHVMFLSAEPKTKFGDQSAQECTKDGTPKWDVQVVAGFNQFGKVTNEVLKVSVASERRPGENLPPATPVHLIGFQVGVMDKTARDGSVIGAQVWYRCDEVRPIAAPSKG